MVRHKFKAKPLNADDKHFASKLEHRYYEQLKLRKMAGDVIFFLTQVPIAIPGGKYIIDFVEFLVTGDVIFTEVKGFPTPLGKLKIKQVEELYPIKINLVTKV